MMYALGLKYEKIGVCPANCMIFWKEHANEKKCLECGQSRFIKVMTQDGEKVMMEVTQKQLLYFAITPHIKQLYISKRTARHMRWYKEGIRKNDKIMGHSTDREAWNVLDRFDANFASDARYVHFGMALDGFDPFSTNSVPYSCRPIFAVTNNLPPSLCMKFELMFLCLIVPGLKAPGPRINVMLKPLIEELKQLWIGVQAYDYYKK
jgi:hypothetical protein